MMATTTLDRFQLTSWPLTMRTPQEMAPRASANTAVLTTRSME